MEVRENQIGNKWKERKTENCETSGNCTEKQNHKVWKGQEKLNHETNYCFKCGKSKVGEEAERAGKAESVKAKTKSGDNSAQKPR